MRLYPPAWVFDRMPIEDIELGGYQLKRGSTIYVSPYVSHRDPRYFDQPDDFQPERFADGWEKRIPRYAYYPFGGGSRVCVGQAFAELEAKIVLAMLLPRFGFTLEAKGEILPEPVATLRPKDGLPLRVAFNLGDADRSERR